MSQTNGLLHLTKVVGQKHFVWLMTKKIHVKSLTTAHFQNIRLIDWDKKHSTVTQLDTSRWLKSELAVKPVCLASNHPPAGIKLVFGFKEKTHLFRKSVIIKIPLTNKLKRRVFVVLNGICKCVQSVVCISHPWKNGKIFFCFYLK